MIKKYGGFEVGDKVTFTSGFHVYEIIEIKVSEQGRYVARIDAEYPEFWADLADLKKVGGKA